ncbi:hypothetical protein DUNSADRAFT_13709 [Dunaliella salina]|uniref:Uncharacterized protein n=1 Tax=Dunaliella salina TaxID=3046 RepID=A0ABQ7H317_DUNSA|nr:hypothetical protein DUNSADRAFT_13709 [Dunaliella salina]|eukprot:KAF5841254.1 hypothetical protein DUNSADRAFT_13709 [Dunaliella salina]
MRVQALPSLLLFNVHSVNNPGLQAICGEKDCSRCGCCQGSREGRKLVLRSASWSQWCDTSHNQDELELLIGFLKACTTHTRAAELLGGVEELMLKGFRKRAGRSDTMYTELAAALLTSCGRLKALVLDNATVLGSPFYERLADHHSNSCVPSLSLDEGHVRGSSLVEGHGTGPSVGEAHVRGLNLEEGRLRVPSLVEGQVKGPNVAEGLERGPGLMERHLKGPGLMKGHVKGPGLEEGNVERGSCSSTGGPKGGHAEPACDQESRRGDAAASLLHSLHLQVGNANKQDWSNTQQVPAPAGCPFMTTAPWHENRGGPDQQAALSSSTRMPLQDACVSSRSCAPLRPCVTCLKLPSTGCMCFQPELRAIAALRNLQHLQLGQAGVYHRRSSFDLSPLSSLTSLRTLQLACDSLQVGWGAVLSRCSHLTHLEVNHGCPFRLPDFHRGRSTSLQCLVVSHCLSLQFLPHLVVATTSNFKQIVLLNKATWGGSLPDLAGPSPAAVHERLTGMHMAWGPAGLIIDSVSRAVVLPCATPLAKLEPQLGDTLMAKSLQALRLENVSFEANQMTSLAVLFPCLRILALESCVFDRCWAVFEAVKGWDDLETLVFIGNDHTTPGCSTTEASLPSMAAHLRTRAPDCPLRIAYHLYKGVRDDMFDHIRKVHAGLANAGALVSWRIDEQHDD